MVVTATREVKTKGQGDTHDLTAEVAAAVKESGLAAGLVTIFVVGSTAAVTTIEFEPGAVGDFNDVLERLAPRRADYKHHARWGDDNGSSHVRAALLGPSLTVPFRNAELMLGTWQQIVLVELDTRGRTRQVVIQMIGDQA
jgi:secondary thiamine-phosphate synthase enzyme